MSHSKIPRLWLIDDFDDKFFSKISFYNKIILLHIIGKILRFNEPYNVLWTVANFWLESLLLGHF